jgi:hypothetical protein
VVSNLSLPTTLLKISSKRGKYLKKLPIQKYDVFYLSDVCFPDLIGSNWSLGLGAGGGGGLGRETVRGGDGKNEKY